MKILSLFDGISCGRIALERANVKVDAYYASEIDEDCIEISKSNYPDIEHIGDVCDISGSDFQDIDLLIAGSPCTDLSLIGSQQGMSTEDKIEITSLEQYLSLKENSVQFHGQSYLFWEFVRLLKEIKLKYFLLENVIMDDKWKTVISETLQCQPVMINSNKFSVQNRKRLYWTNIPIDSDELRTIRNDEHIRDVLKDDYQEYQMIDVDLLKTFTPIKSLNNDIIGTIKQSDKNFCNFVYSDNAKIGTLLVNDSVYPKMVYHNEILRYISAEEAELCQTLPENYTAVVDDYRKRFSVIGNGWTVDVISYIFSKINIL